MKKLKNILPFWQEIIFMIVFTIMLVGQILFIFESIEILLFAALFLAIIICLIGQFYWKNRILSSILGIILGIFSFWMTLAALSELHEIPVREISERNGMLFGVFLFLSLFIITITMPFKYYFGRFSRGNQNNFTFTKEAGDIELDSFINQ